MSESYKKWLKQKLVRLQTIDCYSAGASPETIAEQAGISPNEIVKLNFNESMFIPRAKLSGLIKEVADEIELRLYPEDEEV